MADMGMRPVVPSLLGHFLQRLCSFRLDNGYLQSSLPWTPAALQPVAAWTRWLTRLLLGSLYPGAPFERKFLAMLLLEALLSTWNSPDKANRQNFRCEEDRFCCLGC